MKRRPALLGRTLTLIVIDDVTDPDEPPPTPEQREKLIRWYQEALERRVLDARRPTRV